MDKPNTVGIWHFVGRRLTLHRQAVSTDELLRVERFYPDQPDSLVAVYFGRSQKYPVERFVGVWKMLELEGES